MHTQIPYVLFVLTLFLAFGAVVRRGIVSGRGIIFLGIAVGALAVAATYFNIPARLRGELPMMTVVIIPGSMAICAAICTAIAYRAQQVVDLAVHNLGDTRFVARYAPAGSVDSEAILLATTTTLRMLGGFQGAVGAVAGRSVEQETLSHAPVNVGKVVATGGGKLPVERIFHAAVHEPMRSAQEGDLRRALENAAQQARKAGLTTVAIPVGAMRGLYPATVARVAAEVMVKQRRAFSEIVIVALEIRNSGIVREAVEKAAGEAAAVSR